jgi:hypothetical protein
MRGAEIGVVGHGLYADHPVAGELVIAADLTAADDVPFLAAAEVLSRSDHGTVDQAHSALFGAGRAAADVAADVATGPAVDDDRGRHRRLGVARRHIGGQSRHGNRYGNRCDRTSEEFVHVRDPKFLFKENFPAHQ